MKNQDYAYVVTFLGLIGMAFTFAWIMANG